MSRYDSFSSDSYDSDSSTGSYSSMSEEIEKEKKPRAKPAPRSKRVAGTAPKAKPTKTAKGKTTKTAPAKRKAPAAKTTTKVSRSIADKSNEPHRMPRVRERRERRERDSSFSSSSDLGWEPEHGEISYRQRSGSRDQIHPDELSELQYNSMLNTLLPNANDLWKRNWGQNQQPQDQRQGQTVALKDRQADCIIF